MTRITIETDHHGDVKLTGIDGGPVRFRSVDDHEASVGHELAVALVEENDDVTFASGVPRHREDLRELAAELPTDDVHGNMPSNDIVAFLEQFGDGDLEVLKRDPSALTERREGSETVYEVESDTDDADADSEAQ